MMTTTLFVFLKSKEKNYKESLRSWSAMHAFRVVIAVIEGPVGLTHRSHIVLLKRLYCVKVLLRTDLSPELLIWKLELSSIVGTGYFAGLL